MFEKWIGHYRREETNERIRIQYVFFQPGVHRHYNADSFLHSKPGPKRYRQELRVYTNHHRGEEIKIDDQESLQGGNEFRENAHSLEERVGKVLNSRLSASDLRMLLETIAKNARLELRKKHHIGNAQKNGAMKNAQSDPALVNENQSAPPEPPLGKSLLDGSDIIYGGTEIVNESDFFVAAY